jgi:hypothetical protein
VDRADQSVWLGRCVRVALFSFAHAALLVICILLARESEPRAPGMPTPPGTLFCLPLAVVLSIPRLIFLTLLDPLRGQPAIEVAVWIANSFCYGVAFEWIRPKVRMPVWIRRIFGVAEFSARAQGRCERCGQLLAAGADRCPSCGEACGQRDQELRPSAGKNGGPSPPYSDRDAS